MTKSLKVSVREERQEHEGFEQVPAMARTNYFITAGGRTYYVWRDDADAGTAVFAYYWEGRGRLTNFEFIPYRDPQFRAALAWVTGKLGVARVYLWANHRGLEVDRTRLSPRRR
jgi:hypothetical protein